MRKSVIIRALRMSGGGDLQCHARARRVNILLHVASVRQMSTDGSNEKSNAINWSSYPPWIAIGISAIGVCSSLIGVQLHSASELRNDLKADMSKDKADLKADMSKVNNHLTKLETKLDRHLESNSNLQGKSELLEKVVLKKAWWWW